MESDGEDIFFFWQQWKVGHFYKIRVGGIYRIF